MKQNERNLSAISDENEEKIKANKEDLDNSSILNKLNSMTKLKQAGALSKLLNNSLRGIDAIPDYLKAGMGQATGALAAATIPLGAKQQLQEQKKSDEDYKARKQNFLNGGSTGMGESKSVLAQSMKNMSNAALPLYALNMIANMSGAGNPGMTKATSMMAMPGGLGFANMMGGVTGLGAKTASLGLDAGGAVLNSAGHLVTNAGMKTAGASMLSGGGALQTAAMGAAGLNPIMLGLLGMGTMMGTSKMFKSIQEKWINSSDINKYKKSGKEISLNTRHPRANLAENSGSMDIQSSIRLLQNMEMMTPAEALQASILKGIYENTFAIPDIKYLMESGDEKRNKISGNVTQNKMHKFSSDKSDRTELNKYWDEGKLSRTQKALLGMENFTKGLDDMFNLTASIGKSLRFESTTAGLWDRADKTNDIDPLKAEKAFAKEFNVSLSQVNALHTSSAEVLNAGTTYEGKMLAISAWNAELNKISAEKLLAVAKASGEEGTYGFLAEQKRKMELERQELYQNDFAQRFLRPIDEFASRLPVLGQILPLVHGLAKTTKVITKGISFITDPEKIGNTFSSVTDKISNLSSDIKNWAFDRVNDDINNNEELFRAEIGATVKADNELAYSYLGKYYPDDFQLLLEYNLSQKESLEAIAGPIERSSLERFQTNKFTGERQTEEEYLDFLGGLKDRVMEQISVVDDYSIGDSIISSIFGINEETMAQYNVDSKDFVNDILNEELKVFREESKAQRDGIKDFMASANNGTVIKDKPIVTREKPKEIIQDQTTKFLERIDGGSTITTKDGSFDIVPSVDPKDDGRLTVQEIIAQKEEKLRIEKEHDWGYDNWANIWAIRNILEKNEAGSHGQFNKDFLEEFKQMLADGGDTNILPFGNPFGGTDKNKKNKTNPSASKTSKAEKAKNKAKTTKATGVKGKIKQALDAMKKLLRNPGALLRGGASAIMGLAALGPAALPILGVAAAGGIIYYFKEEIWSFMKEVYGYVKAIPEKISKAFEGAMKWIMDSAPMKALMGIYKKFGGKIDEAPVKKVATNGYEIMDRDKLRAQKSTMSSSDYRGHMEAIPQNNKYIKVLDFLEKHNGSTDKFLKGIYGLKKEGQVDFIRDITKGLVDTEFAKTQFADDTRKEKAELMKNILEITNLTKKDMESRIKEDGKIEQQLELLGEVRKTNEYSLEARQAMIKALELNVKGNSNITAVLSDVANKVGGQVKITINRDVKKHLLDTEENIGKQFGSMPTMPSLSSF